MQDPGAMAPLSAIEIPSGAKVIDLCAAPGGKSSQAAAMIGESGFLLSNEYVPKRAKILVSNFERLGIKNAFVTSMDTDRLTELFSDYFDVAIVDAPCSGEGMFRKNDLAIEEWSEENIKICAERQEKILDNAASLIKAEGYLIYSTCTYAREENEDTVSNFLDRHPEFIPVKPTEEIISATAPAISPASERDLSYFRRFDPHISGGEGQFLAILKKTASDMPTILYKDNAKPLSKIEADAVKAFFDEALISHPEARLCKLNENILLIPKNAPPVPQNSVFMAGVLVGEIQKGRLIPSHQLFSAYGSLFKTKIELSSHPDLLMAYLDGEEIECPEKTSHGYCLITYKGSALGGGKISGTRIKNHYPKGLRNKR
jgi:NOL1/NOP2/fmu family ribosome biogenesis protein/23S rRNA U2552 (ribose-2'-O)-methylase RlmE/FtsJ